MQLQLMAEVEASGVAVPAPDVAPERRCLASLHSTLRLRVPELADVFCKKLSRVCCGCRAHYSKCDSF